jgi:hypothetical protein
MVWLRGIEGEESAEVVAEKMGIPLPPPDSGARVFGGANGGTVLTFESPYPLSESMGAWRELMERRGWTVKSPGVEGSDISGEWGNELLVFERGGVFCSVQGSTDESGTGHVTLVLF